MSKVQLQGNVSGTGVFTIASPNSNTDRTLTLPDNTGTILTSASAVTQNSGPAFIADTSGTQSITAGVATKIAFDIASVNLNSNFNTSTYRFTPTVAGYYQLSGGVQIQTVSTTCVATAVLFKNGGVYMYGGQCPATSNNFPIAGVSGLMYLNGTTDFAEFYAISVGVTTVARGFNFQGILVRTG
jgi:hypothetical protein